MNLKMLYLLLLFFNDTQTNEGPNLGGTYYFGSNTNNKPSGWLTIYPKEDLTFFFYLDINRGAPSFNMGQKYGQAYFQPHKGYWQYTEIDSVSNTNCSLIFSFEKSKAEIKTISDKENCGFGYGVNADGKYKLYSKIIPKYFISQTEDTMYFSKTTPEMYNGNK